MSAKKTLHAFTLIELLVVVSIIALLVSILLPALGKAREQAKMVVCGTNLRSMGLAVSMYQGEYNDSLPAIDWNPWMNKSNYWQGQLAIYLGWQGDYDTDLTYATGVTEAMATYPDKQLDVFICPSVKPKQVSLWGNSYGINHYLWSTKDVRGRYWKLRNLEFPRQTFLLMDAAYYLIGDPAQAKAVPVHVNDSKDVLFADLHVEFGYRDPYAESTPLGWYDFSLWGDTISAWAQP